MKDKELRQIFDTYTDTLVEKSVKDFARDHKRFTKEYPDVLEGMRKDIRKRLKPGLWNWFKQTEEYGLALSATPTKAKKIISDWNNHTGK